MSYSPLYGYQISPGFDDLISYGFSLEAVVKEAEDMRLEKALEEENPNPPPTAIYEFTLNDVTPDQLVAVLNERVTLNQVLIGDRRLVRVVDG